LRALSTAQVAELLRVPCDQVRVRLHAPRQRGEWIAPARGLWVPVPPQYRAWGAPPALEFLDALMTHLNVPYYVGWLSAASIHGSAHHAAQVTQVATGRTVAARAAGRSRIKFYRRGRIAEVPTTAHLSPAGEVPVSTPEATALDVAADPLIAAGMDNAATVIVGMAVENTLEPARLAALVPLYPIAAIRRVGWVLEHHTDLGGLDDLRQAALASGPEPSRLAPYRPRGGPLDRSWNLHVNAELEVET
jgi:predicted transcriptional regulator of viral defense system